MKNGFIEKLENNPVIAAVKDEDGLTKAIDTECEIIFILYGDICSIADIVKKVKSSGKIAMVHMDLIAGLGAGKEISVDYIKNNIGADGIITTKANLIERANELGLYTVLRYFVIDSMALVNIEKQDKRKLAVPDVIEILPGILQPKIFQRINRISRVPVIAGGLITDRDDVMNALNNGVLAVSTTNEVVWGL